MAQLRDDIRVGDYYRDPRTPERCSPPAEGIGYPFPMPVAALVADDAE
ncbi:hypothetical protein [Nocardia sp. NBC_00403]